MKNKINTPKAVVPRTTTLFCMICNQELEPRMMCKCPEQQAKYGKPMKSLDKKKPKELDKEITEILICMYNSGDTTNCLADIKKLILEAEMKKGLQDFQICREELTQQRTELLKEAEELRMHEVHDAFEKGLIQGAK